MTDRYINIFTGYGFNNIFGKEENKDLYFDFTQSLLQSKPLAIDFAAKKINHLGCRNNRAAFDLYCENDKGEKTIIEIQASQYNFFKDKNDFFATFPIAKHGKPDAWNFEIDAIYTIGLFNFCFRDQDRNKTVVSNAQSMNSTGEKNSSETTTLVCLQLPNFTKSEDELNTRLDSWLFCLKNLHKLHECPTIMNDKIFEKLFEASEISRIPPIDQEYYEFSLKYYRDLKNSFDTAYEEGLMLGRSKVL